MKPKAFDLNFTASRWFGCVMAGLIQIYEVWAAISTFEAISELILCQHTFFLKFIGQDPSFVAFIFHNCGDSRSNTSGRLS